jgi:hydrogenase nickel incorporation protein HypA/HybF
MHELSLARAILSCAERHAAGRRVTEVHVRVGALRQVVPATLAFHWEIVSRETLCEQAALALEAVPACVGCRGCGRQWQLTEPLLTCSECGGSAAVISGEELEVESIEVEEVDPRCTAQR